MRTNLKKGPFLTDAGALNAIKAADQFEQFPGVTEEHRNAIKADQFEQFPGMTQEQFDAIKAAEQFEQFPGVTEDHLML